jgi:transcriptional regulator with XRE-family HTH domain
LRAAWKALLRYGVDDFGPLLAAHLERLGLQQKEFAERLRIHPTTVNKVVLGTRAPNWRKAEAWAKALDLSGADAERFINAMHLAAASPRVRQLFKALERQVRKP